ADQEIVAAANGIPAQAEQWARAGSLERIPDLKKWDLAGNTFTGTDADSLLDAIAWVDQNAATGEEYLIRVEQDEEAPNIKITFAGQDKVTLRLRGYGAERTIKHNGSINALYWNPAVSMAISYDVFFSLGGMDSGGYIIADSIHSLHLENNITFDGKGADRMDNHFRGLISMGRNSRLILLEGSKITNYNGTSGQSESFVPVYIQGGMSAPGSEEMLVSFYMYGGAITGNDLAGPSTVVGIDSVGYTPVFFNTRANTTGSSSLATRINQPVFFIFGGSYSGNFRHPLSGGEPESGDKVRFGLSSSYSTMYDIEPGHAYALPEFN
ncbi:MAG: hypothetical protein LBD37_07195, partial [Treponema sp.]|nr:hypothetical protein [Treponema sp.]